MALGFEWDAKKAVSNRRKHGVSFQEARTIFGDQNELMISDREHSEEEERFISIGRSERGRILLVAYTEAESLIRIISARLADNDEVGQYRGRCHE